MVTIIRDRIRAMIKKGMTLDEIQASRPTMDYDARYGADKGFNTTDEFVAAVYKSLGGSRLAEANCMQDFRGRYIMRLSREGRIKGTL